MKAAFYFDQIRKSTMTKSELRQIYLEKRKSLSSAARNEKSRQIAALFFQHFDLSRIQVLHCFLPIERTFEIDTNLIVQKARQDFPSIEILVPRVNFITNEIENVRFTPETKLRQNKWRIAEPTENETVETGKIDAILVPLLCFDERGFRVGYGKGFYDRFLKNCRADCLKIGLSYFAAAAEISDAQEFDIPLDFCVMPKMILSFGK